MHPVLFHIGSFLIPSYGAFSALGVLVALFLAQRTARIAGVNSSQIWNLCVIALFAALAGQRLLLIAINFTDLRSHPRWMLGLAMIHHPLPSAAGALAGLIAAVVYARAKKMPAARTADALVAPLALGLACEQLGALMAGSGYGTMTGVRWAVTYTNILAARWSGTPLGVPLHPVQAYSALAFLTLAIFLLVLMPASRQAGDIAGMWLMGSGVAIYVTEIWRDAEGRGSLLRGALDGPQVAAILFVLAGGLVLRERRAAGSGDASVHEEAPGHDDAPGHESELNHGQAGCKTKRSSVKRGFEAPQEEQGNAGFSRGGSLCAGRPGVASCARRQCSR